MDTAQRSRITMSAEPINNIAASIAGSAAAQSARADARRAERARPLAAHDRTGQAAGILAADGKEIGPNDRDADGRRFWETPAGADPSDGGARPAHDPPRAGADSSDSRGKGLDLLA
jgi:hypothetical protein